MMKQATLIVLITISLLFGFQNCGNVNVDKNDQNSVSSKVCNLLVLGIRTDNTSPDFVHFTMLNLETLATVSDKDFAWSYNKQEPIVASDLKINKAELVACRTYEITASYRDCDQNVVEKVSYTADALPGESCNPPEEVPEDPPVDPPVEDPPPVYPPADPAPPGQQTAGLACTHYNNNTNPNFDYANAKYCLADYSVSDPQLLRCKESGFDFTGVSYFPVIKPGKYLAIKVKLPHPFTNGISKTLCGFYVNGETGNPCGSGQPGGAIDTWALSPNPGDFSPSGLGCVTHTTVGGMHAHVGGYGGCNMDPGRDYYLNITMGNNCTDPRGCNFLLKTYPIYSGTPHYINGQRFVTDTSCKLVASP